MDDGIQKPKVNPLIKRFLLTLSYPTTYVASLWGRIGVGTFFGYSVGREAYDFCELQTLQTCLLVIYAGGSAERVVAILMLLFRLHHRGQHPCQGPSS